MMESKWQLKKKFSWTWVNSHAKKTTTTNKQTNNNKTPSHHSMSWPFYQRGTQAKMYPGSSWQDWMLRGKKNNPKHTAVFRSSYGPWHRLVHDQALISCQWHHLVSAPRHHLVTDPRHHLVSAPWHHLVSGWRHHFVSDKRLLSVDAGYPLTSSS